VTTTAARASLVPVLALGSGIAVADNYYLQPLLALIARDLGVGIGAMGVVSSLALLGYALGLLLVVPLGDVVDRRPLVTGVLGLTTTSLAVLALAPSVGVLAVAAFGVGLTSVVAQVLVPYAVSLADDASRGRVAGTMMSGILVGILGARVVAGLLGGAVGWRLVYAGAAGLTGALLLLLLRRLPTETDRHRRNGRPDVPYVEVLARVGRLARQHLGLRVRAAYGFCGFGVFSAVWTTLAFHLRDAYGLGPTAVAAVAVLGVAGALVSPRAGAVADRGHVTAVTGLSYTALLLSTGLLALGSSSLGALLAGLVVLDLAVQSGHVASLGVVYRLAGEARSGATTVYMTSVFAGGATGSVVAAGAYGAAGWGGVAATCAVFAGGALGLWLRRLHVGAPVELDEPYPESVA
jgi:predicted MFS family arabinose efflux permease